MCGRADDSLSSPDNCAWLAGKLGKCIIGMRTDAFAPQSLDCFLESGICPGLKFAIMYVSVTEHHPGTGSSRKNCCHDLPFRTLTAALILIRAGGNQSVLFHLTCGRIVNPSGPRTPPLARCSASQRESRLCATAGRAIRLEESSELGQ